MMMVDVPSGVPPIPGSSGQAMSDLPVGISVTLNSSYSVKALRGQTGTIVSSNGGLREVTLASGATLARIPRGALDIGVGGTTEASIELGRQTGEFYLNKAHGLQATLPSWAALFWQAVKNEKDLYGLESPMRVALEAHVYLGDASVGPPRVDDLKKALGGRPPSWKWR